MLLEQQEIINFSLSKSTTDIERDQSKGRLRSQDVIHDYLIEELGLNAIDQLNERDLLSQRLGIYSNTTHCGTPVIARHTS